MSAELTPLSGGLVTMSEAVGVIQGAGTSNPTEADVALLIEQASAAVRDYTGKRFDSPAVTATRSVFCDGSSVWAPELVTVTGVTDLDGNALLYVTDPGEEHISRLILHDDYTGTVRVTGTWGWASVPAPVKRAVLVTVRVWYAAEYSTVTAIGDDVGAVYPRVLSLPRDVLPLLNPYRDVRI